MRTAEKNFDLSAGRLADGKQAEEHWPLNRSIERRIPKGIGPGTDRGRIRVAFTGILNMVIL